MPDKSSEFRLRAPAPLRFGYRVLRCHQANNQDKTQWLMHAIEEKLEREEQALPSLPGPRPLRISELRHHHTT